MRRSRPPACRSACRSSAAATTITACSSSRKPGRPRAARSRTGRKRRAHDPEKHVLDPDRGWEPVFGQDHAPPIRGGNMATRYTKDHEWIRLDGDVATVGITEHAQSQLGDIVYVELPEIGRQVEKGGEAAVVESVKAASDVYAPASGEVIA